MSIVGMADAAIQRKRVQKDGAPTTVVARTAPTAAAGRTITPLKGASDVARYIPTEAIGLYIAILAGAFAKLTPKPPKKFYQLDFSGRWHFYFAMLAITAALVWLVYAAKTRSQDRRRRDVPVFEMVIAVFAMAAWAAALPDSPWADFKWYGGWFPPIVLSTTTALLPLIAAAFGKMAPTYVEAPATGQPTPEDG